MPSNQFRNLTETNWNNLQERADRFADELQKGPVADWEPFLTGLDPATRKTVLHELVKIDLDHQWTKGGRILLEEYLSLQPDIGDRDTLPVDLICEEFRVRQKRGGSPDLDDYYGRFPEQFAAIKKELERENPNFQETLGTAGGSLQQLHTLVSSPSELLKQQQKKSPLGTQAQKPDNYEKTEMLGHGHFGEVWKAKAPGGIEVAIKVVTQPIERDAAQREMQALELVKNLRHPCLLTTSAFWIENDRLHIVMELADGTMRDRLKACRKQGQQGIPLQELLMYFADAAEGLDFLHTRKVFHRDIKPDNILLLHGHAKVADFGLARLQERQMMTVSFAGTPVYMAPEAWGGKGGPRTDQYSLAFAYAELRQGRRPIEASDFTEVMSKTIEGALDLSGVPPEEAKIVRRALSNKPEERFNNCSEFVAALARATGNPVRLRTPAEEDMRHLPGSDSKGGSDTFKESYKETQQPAPTKKGGGKLGLLIGLSVAAGLAVFAIWYFALKNPSTPTEVAKDAIQTKPEPTTPADPTPKEKEPKEKDKPKDNLFVPEKFTAVVGSPVAQIGMRRVPERIEYTLPNGSKAVFILIMPTGGLKPFYMMENKVDNAFFAAFVDANKPALLSDWKKEGPPTQPATRVNARDAWLFGKWLGGSLPTTKQWDYAAGMRNRAGRDGPSLKEGTAAVGRSEPRAIDDPIHDEGPFAVRDLAGNGREWTRDILMPDGTTREGPLDKPASGDLAILRGRNFTLSKPLTYADLEYEAKVPQTQYYLKGSPYTTFRVVLDVPE